MIAEAIELEGQAEREMARNYAMRRAHEERMAKIESLGEIVKKKGVEIFTKD